MFVPLHDSTPLKVIRFQLVTVTIIAVNLVMYAVTGGFVSENIAYAIAAGWGLIPGELTGVLSPAIGYDPVAEPLTLITYQFLHAGWWHVISNMLFLWVFADNIEDAFGHTAFAFFYLLCGVCAGLFHVLISPASGAPLVGASGAVSGILGAYVVLFPKSRVWILLFLRLPLRIGAVWVLGGWFALQIFSWWMDRANADAGIAFGAHVGGFLTGLAITFAIRRRLWMRLAA